MTTWRSDVNHMLHICHVFIQVRSQIKVFNLRMFGMFSGAFAKLRKATISCVMCVYPSVWPHGTTRPQLDGFVLNLIVAYIYIYIYIFENLSRKFKFY